MPTYGYCFIKGFYIALWTGALRFHGVLSFDIGSVGEWCMPYVGESTRR